MKVQQNDPPINLVSGKCAAITKLEGSHAKIGRFLFALCIEQFYIVLL